ncbi:MAG: thioredoxin family protein [Egibacteraceae bacterium]
MIELGSSAPDFSLTSLDSATVSLPRAGEASAVLVAFICNHCPYVRHVEDGLAALGQEYAERGVAVFGICSNDAEAYPDDGPEGLRAQVERASFTFPYLIDATQEVARCYGAVCTPDFFALDGDLRLAYRGQMDSSRPRGDEPVTGADLRAALDALLAGQPAPTDQRPSVGCSIKWKPG